MMFDCSWKIGAGKVPTNPVSKNLVKNPGSPKSLIYRVGGEVHKLRICIYKGFAIGFFYGIPEKFYM